MRKKKKKKNHGKPFVPCVVGVVFTIPLTGGRAFIGRTGPVWQYAAARKHQSILIAAASGHLAVHCDSCEWKPIYEGIFHHREIIEDGSRQQHGGFLAGAKNRNRLRE